MDQRQKPSPDEFQPDSDLKPNPAVDEFLTRMTKDVRHPRPGQEAVGAALQAIQRLAVEMDAESLASERTEAPVCNSCGATNRAGNRFCSACGVPLQVAPVQAIEVSPQTPPVALPPGDHHYHHHYHHHYFSSTDGGGVVPTAEPKSNVGSARVRPPATGGLSRAETAVRQLTQDWARACNSKHIDDLVSLYAADATVMRPNYPAVRGTSAIREFFCGVLEAGLGDVELEAMRTEVLGDVAYEAGRCKSLVPAVGKRREERGKYLLICMKQNAEWRILADSWSSDLGVAIDVPPAAAPGLPKTPRR